VTQPSLSNQLKHLEKRLGAQLFERSRKHVMITEFGRQFVARAKDILQQMDDLETMTDAPFTGNLKMGLFPTLAPYLLPTIMPKLIDTFPTLRFVVSEERTAQLVQQLKDGSLDCILAAEPLAETQFAHTHLFGDAFFLAVYSDHPFASRSHVSVQDLRHEPLLLLEEGHCMRDHALSVCALAGNSSHEDYRATSMETLRYMVAAKIGITLIPELAVPKPPADTSKRVVYIPFRDRSLQRNIGLYWRKNSGKSAVFEAIVMAIKTTIPVPKHTPR
jgi:LysR family hydrogen peroxide-inducible transcriptional activator